MIDSFSPEWRNWIAENIARGCTDHSMIESMVRANIDQTTARTAISELRLASNITPGVPAMHPSAAFATPVRQASRLQLPRNVIHTRDRDVHVAMWVSQPCVALLNNVLTPQECDELIDLSRVKLKRSTIVDPLSGAYKVIADRSSSGTFFAIQENDFITRLDLRISDLMNSPTENGEGLQILNYQVGAEYTAHFDYFPPDNPGSPLHLAQGGQRISTLILYLNDVEDGGETIFPRINLSVCPRKGSAVYFEYCNAAGEVDPMTLHGGSPVRKGEKWIATKWMRQFKYVSV